MREQTILITGGTGFLGQGLTRRILEHNPAHIRIFSRSEHKQLEMVKKFPDPRIDYLIGDIRDYRRLRLAMKGADLVIHCAALKCIEKGQSDPLEFLKTNCQGAMNLVDCALELGTPKVIGISTDKAAGSVTNLYGASKLTADMLFQASNNYNLDGKPEFIVVRYGNVIGSTGSVIPLWQKQKLAGKPLTITHPDMTRFLITLNQAIDLIFYAIDKGLPGDILIPDIKACTVADLAIAFDKDAECQIVGLRPGERMFEVLEGTNGNLHSDDCERLNLKEIGSMIDALQGRN